MTGNGAGLLIAGFPGLRPDEGIVDLIRRGLAGVILFSRNIESAAQVRSLIAELQAIASRQGHPPLLIAIDHEGGRVQRLHVPGITRQPPVMALGATADPGLTRMAALTAGRELAWLGINCCLAPCADLNGVPRSQVVGTRAFGDDPGAVAGHVTAYIQGLQEAGVLAVAKHFPGHGATVVDSHFDLPRVERSVASLRAAELVPFAAAIQAGVAAVMPGHLVVPQLTGELPATLSRTAITVLLRHEMGHQGLVISDCMEMQAISPRYSPADASCRAVAAGTDLVLWSHTLASQLEAAKGLDDAGQDSAEFGRSMAGALARVREARMRLREGQDAGLPWRDDANPPSAEPAWPKKWHGAR